MTQLLRTVLLGLAAVVLAAPSVTLAKGELVLVAGATGRTGKHTVDHSVVAELVQAGELTEEQAELDPRRSMITRALGVEPGIDVDVITLELVPGDRVLLCSDGLTSMVREDDIVAILAREVDPTRAADAADRRGQRQRRRRQHHRGRRRRRRGRWRQRRPRARRRRARPQRRRRPTRPLPPRRTTTPRPSPGTTRRWSSPLPSRTTRPRGLRLPPEPSTGVVDRAQDIVRAELRADRRAQQAGPHADGLADHPLGAARRPDRRPRVRRRRLVRAQPLLRGPRPRARHRVPRRARRPARLGPDDRDRGPGSTSSELTARPARRRAGQQDVLVPADANAYVNELRAGVRHRATSSTTTTTPTTTTTTTTSPPPARRTTPGAPGATG